ncbi:hypothetical protein [Arthrobacter sp. MDT1-65]
MSLDDIKARVADCKTYNFGMRNADKLAHEDAPKLVAALEAILTETRQQPVAHERIYQIITETLDD